MEQAIRFTELDGKRIAYTSLGAGPLLLFGGRWVTHLEAEWELAGARAFYEALARTHRVVRYDRIGAGLSDREPAGPPTVESETRALEAVFEACGEEPATLFACSCAGLAAARFASTWPNRVSRVVFFGGYVSRGDIPDAARDSIVQLVRANWALAAQMFSGLKLPHGSGDEIEELSRYQRRSAEAEVAAAFLDLDLTADAGEWLPGVTMPALVLHRRGDRTVPIGRGRELAAALPNARFVALSGDSHLPWRDDQRDAPAGARGVPRHRAGRGSERRLTAVAPRDGRPPPRRLRPVEPRDRLVAGPLRAHRAPARREHPAEARPVVPRRGRGAGDARGVHLGASLLPLPLGGRDPDPERDEHDPGQRVEHASHRPAKDGA